MDDTLTGAILIEGENFEEALNETQMMGINPGGWVYVSIINPSSDAYKNMPRNRFLSPKELNELGYFTEEQKRKMS